MKLEREEFEKWLEDHAHLDFSRFSPTECPIGRYLNITFGDAVGRKFFVTRDLIREWSRSGAELHHFTPDWAHNFIREFDAIRADSIRTPGTRALGILKALSA